MLRITRPVRWFWRVQRMSRAPRNGYELAELRDEHQLRDFLRLHHDRVVLAVIHHHLSLHPPNPKDLRYSTEAESAGDEGRLRLRTSESDISDAAAAPTMGDLFRGGPRGLSMTPETHRDEAPKKEEDLFVANESSPLDGAWKKKAWERARPTTVLRGMMGLGSAKEKESVRPGQPKQSPLYGMFDSGGRALALRLVASFNNTTLGDPKEVRIAAVPAERAPVLIQKYGVLALPTTLIFFKGQLKDRVVGFRPAEVSTKTRFLMRNEGLNIFAV